MCELEKVLISSWSLHAHIIPNQLAVYLPTLLLSRERLGWHTTVSKSPDTCRSAECAPHTLGGGPQREASYYPSSGSAVNGWPTGSRPSALPPGVTSPLVSGIQYFGGSTRSAEERCASKRASNYKANSKATINDTDTVLPGHSFSTAPPHLSTLILLRTCFL